MTESYAARVDAVMAQRDCAAPSRRAIFLVISSPTTRCSRPIPADHSNVDRVRNDWLAANPPQGTVALAGIVVGL